MPRQDHKPIKDDLSTVWDVMKSLAFFLGIHLLFTGWLYLYYYFMNFGMYYTNMKFEIASVYSYGFLTLLDKTMSITFFTFAVLLFFLYYHRQALKYAYAIIFSLVIAFFFLSYFIVENKATNDAQNILDKQFGNHQPPAIYFDFKKDFLESMAKDSLERAFLPKKDSVLTPLARTRRNIQDGKTVTYVDILKYNNDNALYLFFETDEAYYVIFNNAEPRAANDKSPVHVKVKLYCVYKKDLNYASRIINY